MGKELKNKNELNRKLFFIDTCLAEVQDDHEAEIGEELKETIYYLRQVIEKEMGS